MKNKTLGFWFAAAAACLALLISPVVMPLIKKKKA